jgi:D-erythronate 2-dehydrogenase
VMRDLVTEVARQTGADPLLVSHRPDPALEAAFGRQPPLFTARADALGLHHDSSLAALVTNALSDL